MSSSLRLLQLNRGTYYTTGESGGPPAPPPPTPVFLIEDTDYGVVKVQGGKLVLDMDDFAADLGNF
jgi:hypothetical protein